jgi:hypothetical protein
MFGIFFQQKMFVKHKKISQTLFISKSKTFMNLLRSKVQYRDFEAGEFVSNKDRTFEEVIDLIEKFPWQTQREKIIINLTNPSVTIEGLNQDYLKLGLSYNGKFVLHYFDAKQTLYTKIFLDFHASYSYIDQFYKGILNLSEFKKENTWRQRNLKHFVSKDFHYSLSRTNMQKFLYQTTAFNFLLTGIMIIYLLFNGLGSYPIVVICFAGFFFFIAGGGLNLMLFFNYYKYCKGKILVMSRGNDIFYYGSNSQLTKYSKQDIQVLITTKYRYRDPFLGFAYSELKLKNGEVIILPSLIIDDLDLSQKLFMCDQEDRNEFPYINN